MLKINVDNTNKNFKLKKNSIKKLIRFVLTDQKCSEGEIGIVFIDHDFMVELNNKFLQKNSTTDVLSFPLGESNSSLMGEIYVNLDKAAEQAAEYNVALVKEMYRIIIHGLLHLFDYDDQTITDKQKMTEMEDYYLDVIKRMEFNFHSVIIERYQ